MAYTESEKELIDKMCHALNNNQNMTTEELKAVHDEVVTYAKSLGGRCGAFLWEIGFEPFSMIVAGREYEEAGAAKK